jgi:hypothetical protein
MIPHPGRRIEVLLRSVACLPLACLLAVAGCGNPGEGTVKVSPEARARLAPPAPAPVKGSKKQHVGERSIGIRSRNVSSTK